MSAVVFLPLSKGQVAAIDFADYELGCFVSGEAASAAYSKKADELFGAFANNRSSNGC